MRLKKNNCLQIFLGTKLRPHATFAVLSLAFLLANCISPSTVHASGGVGGGGTGTSGCGKVGNWTCNGWGWAQYPPSGNIALTTLGPSDGFHNKTTWNSILNTCGPKGANTPWVDVFIINDQNGGGMGYDYLSADQNFPGNFNSGQLVDYGRGKAIDTNTAYNNYKIFTSNPANKGIVAGYTWGVNVSWFCAGSLGSLGQSGWTLNGHSTVDKTSVSNIGSTGDTITFSHTVTNKGPGDATGLPSPEWYIQGCYSSTNSCDSTSSIWTEYGCSGVNQGIKAGYSCPLASGSPSYIGAGQTNPYNWKIAYTFPGTASNGDEYCQRIAFKLADGPVTGTRFSDDGADDGTTACTYYSPTPPKSGNIQGSVFELSPNGTRTNLSGYYVSDCNTTWTTSTWPKTDTSGSFTFSESGGAHFGVYLGIQNVGCSAGFANPVPAGYSGPYVRPWGGASGSAGPAFQGYSGCGPFNTNYTYNPPSTTSYCSGTLSGGAPSSSHYDWQWAKELVPYSNTSASNGGVTCKAPSGPTPSPTYDRDDCTWDGGYDFVYVPNTPPQPTVSGNASCINTAVTGSASENTTSQSIDIAVFVKSAQNGSIVGYTAGTGGTVTVPGVGTGGRYGTDASHNFSIPADPSLIDGYGRQFIIYAIGADSNGTDDGLFSTATTANMPACAVFTTGGATATTLAPTQEAPTSYNTTSSATVTYDPGTNPAFNPAFSMGCNVTVAPKPPAANDCSANFQSGTISISGPNGTITPASVNYGDQYCPTLTLEYTNGIVQDNGNGTGTVLSNTGGPFTVSNNAGCQIMNEPYVQFYGNDVTAGAGFNAAGGGACTQYTSGTIDTFNNGSASYTGSGGQFGAFALGSISQFVSAIQRGFPPAPPTGLTFANTAGSGGYGGNFGKSGADYCVENYYDKKPTSTTNLASATLGSGSAVESTTGQHAYSHVGTDLTINGLNIANGVNSAVYVDGNVYITGNITYSGAAGAWAGINDIPSLFIVTSPGHNIYIEPSVTQLDGVYVAEPDANNQNNNGVIDTCNDGTFNFKNASDDSLKTTCGSQLVVNGSFVAQQINLHRTLSSLRYAQAGESLNSSPRDCGGGIFYADCAAEVFNFSPELYLSLPGITPAGGPSRQTFDAYDSLSPIL